MAEDFRCLRAVAPIALIGALIGLAGCAGQGLTAPISVEQKIENASNRVDHEDLAVRYESQAALNAAAAKRHQGYAAIYRKNTSPRNGPEAHLALAMRCENLARTYQQAADEILALANLHRRLADDAK